MSYLLGVRRVIASPIAVSVSGGVLAVRREETSD